MSKWSNRLRGYDSDRMVFVIDRTLFDNDRIFYAETVYFQAKAVYFKSGSQNLLGSYTVYRYLFPTFDNAKNDH